MLQKFLFWHFRHRWAGVAVVLVFSALGLSQGTEIPLRLSLASLLPENRESVRDLNEVSAEVGGVGYLIVLVGPTKQPERHLKSLAKSLNSLKDVKYTFFEREEYTLKNFALYLLPKEEFTKVLESAKTLLQGGKKSLLDLGLEEEEEQDQNVKEARDYIRRLKKGSSERYFISSDGKYAMLLVKPHFDSENLQRSKELVESVTHKIQEDFLGRFPFQLIGRYVNKVRDTKQIEKDIAFTSIISFIAISAVLVLGLGAFRAAILTVVMVMLAMTWTVGFAKVFVGQINILTGFLLAILGGLGVEYGVHLIRRYYQERQKGLAHEMALIVSYKQMGRALGSAALTSSASFLILSFSDFRGFSELGVIAGMGILSIYVVYMLSFPAIGAMLNPKARFIRTSEIFGIYPINARWRLPIVVFGLICVWGLYEAEFEYDFQRMHQLSAETVRTHQFVNELFGRSFTPAALLAKDQVQAAQVAEWLSREGAKQIVQEAVSLKQLLPDDMKERWDKIKTFRTRLEGLNDQEVFTKTGLAASEIRAWLNQKPYTQKSLPPQLQDAFGRSGNIVLAYSAVNLDLAQGLRQFNDILLLAKKEFPELKIGSDVRIFTEILDHITKDGLVILFVFLLGAFFTFWIDFGSWRDALALEIQLIAGLVLMVALMGIAHERFSILNVAMIPAVLAAGIDIGVHVRHRQKEGFSAIASARFVAQAVQLSALTTALGFGAMFFAEAGMLKGIAWISVLGQVAMYTVCMIIWPVFQKHFPIR